MLKKAIRHGRLTIGTQLVLERLEHIATLKDAEPKRLTPEAAETSLKLHKLEKLISSHLLRAIERLANPP